MRSFGLQRGRRLLGIFTMCLVVALVCVHVLLAAYRTDTGQRHFLLQANALLHGHLDIDPTGLTDIAYVDGRAYVPFPPGPALVLLPFVALLGVDHVNTTLIALLLALVTLWSFLQVLAHLNVGGSNRAWLATAFFLGTGYWSTLTQGGHVWFFAHIVAVAFMVLALEEALGHARGWLAGLYVGMAFLSRQLAITVAPAVALLLWVRGDQEYRERARKLVPFALVLAVAIAGYLLFNAIRFGNPLDTGYGHIQLSGFLEARVARYGLFSLAYVPFNFVHMFLQGWHLDYGGPLDLTPLGVSPFGVSLLAASPFLLLALWATNSRRIRATVWASVIVALMVMLLYYNNGWVQTTSQRFALDFLPVLFLLVVDGAQRVDARIFKGTVAYAVALNFITLILLPILR